MAKRQRKSPDEILGSRGFRISNFLNFGVELIALLAILVVAIIVVVVRAAS